MGLRPRGKIQTHTHTHRVFLGHVSLFIDYVSFYTKACGYVHMYRLHQTMLELSSALDHMINIYTGIQTCYRGANGMQNTLIN